MSAIERMVHWMGDGTPLVGDYHAPSCRPRRVLLLLRSDMPRSGYKVLGEFLSSRGYGLLVQSVRGRHGSGGLFMPYRNEGEDGAAVVSQLASSRVFKGHRIVLVGEGYAGQAALAAAVRCPPGLLAGVAVADVSDNLFTDGLCTNGVLTGMALSQLLSWCRGGLSSIELDGYWRWLPGVSPLEAEPLMEFWALSLRDSQDSSGIWEQAGCLLAAAQLKALAGVPMLLLSGYSLMTGGGACRLASRLLAFCSMPLEFAMGAWKAPFWRPGVHGIADEFQEMDGGADALRRLFSWLDGLSSGKEASETSDEGRKVGYFMHDVPSVMHPGQDLCRCGQWFSGRAFLSGGANRRLFLHFGTLSEAAVSGVSATRSCYVSEPLRGVRVTRDAWKAGGACAGGGEAPFRRGDPLWGPEACVFYGPVLKEPLVLRAAMRLHLWCSISRGDAVIGARLFAELPGDSRDGGGAACGGGRRRSVLLSRGICRAGYRYGMGQLVSAVNGGPPVELTIPFFPAAWTLPAGCRLRLEVGDCESPLWIAPPRPDARSPDLAGLPVQNTICIHHDCDHPSRLVY